MSPSIKAAVLASGMHLSTVGSAFIRNIIFARLLSPEDFGLAMTFGVVLLLLEYVSNFGHESLLLRSHHGNAHGFQSTIHSSLILRGIFLAGLIVLSAPYISSFFKLPQDTFNYAWLALVPLIRGFAHIDSVRAQRNQNFLPYAIVVFWADGLSILMALICAYFLDSYWAFYFSFLFRHCIGTVLSHTVATRPYRLSFHKKYLSELLSFGLPLIAVGVIKYLAGEADKALIARESGLELFTSYLLTLMLISNGFNLVSNAFSKIFIRRISKEKKREEQRLAYESNGVITIYLLMPISLLMCVFAESIVTVVFGASYHPVQFLIPVICCLTLFRSLNHWLNQIVIATCNTRILIASDLSRLTGLMLAIFLSNYFSDVRIFCAAFCLGELICFFFLSACIAMTHKDFISFSLKILLLSMLGMLFVAGIYHFLETKALIIKILVSGAIMISFLWCSCRVSSVCMSTTHKLYEYLKTILEGLRNQFLAKTI